ncbi:MAG: hypothetical protein OSJ65_05520 [Bacilli bacterium]|nr:hypothetical protein [Bacilli bacterium]
MKKVLSIIVSPVYALEGVIYDNSASGSSATNVNDALNDLYSKLNEKQTEINNIKNIGNATSDKILSGYTAYVKGNTITGSIPSKGAATYTPGTSKSNNSIRSILKWCSNNKRRCKLSCWKYLKWKNSLCKWK